LEKNFFAKIVRVWQHCRLKRILGNVNQLLCPAMSPNLKDFSVCRKNISHYLHMPNSFFQYCPVLLSLYHRGKYNKSFNLVSCFCQIKCIFNACSVHSAVQCYNTIDQPSTHSSGQYSNLVMCSDVNISFFCDRKQFIFCFRSWKNKCFAFLKIQTG
jgi:hypothetical protein